jgi:hypothetical protein
LNQWQLKLFGASPGKSQSALNILQNALVALGFVLILAYALAQAHSHVGRAQALSEFARAQGDVERSELPLSTMGIDHSVDIELDVESPWQAQDFWSSQAVRIFGC